MLSRPLILCVHYLVVKKHNSFKSWLNFTQSYTEFTLREKQSTTFSTQRLCKSSPKWKEEVPVTTKVLIPSSQRIPVETERLLLEIKPASSTTQLSKKNYKAVISSHTYGKAERPYCGRRNASAEPIHTRLSILSPCELYIKNYKENAAKALHKCTT